MNWVDPYGLLEVNSALLGSGVSLVGAGGAQSTVGVALIATGNPIGFIPLTLGVAKVAAGTYMALASFGYDPFNMFPGVVPNNSTPCP